MKYLFLILVCYAVKCEDVGNKYFVFKMPEDIRQHDVMDFKKPFRVYWNVPTMQCASKKIPFQNLYEKFGIIQNDNDRFLGNKIVVIYDEKDFPAVITNKGNDKNILRNGGVPQEGKLKNHLIAFENDLKFKIPDPYFDGIAVIDFESWRPMFRQNFGTLKRHNRLSIEIEKQLHNWWPKMWIEKEASLRFEAAARKFMQTTLTMAKAMRPNALWGYYGFPHCFNMRNREMAEKCADNVDRENDSIYWLWAESTAIFPSLYSSVSLTPSQLSSLIKGRVKEASRVRGIETPIFPYFWYRYTDAGFMTEKDLEAAFSTLYQSDASGFIIWGSSNDVNTVEKCKKLFEYVETVLGPKIAKYTKKIKSTHKDLLENKEIYSKETSAVYDGFSHSQSTKSLKTDQMFSTETSTVNNKYTKTDEISQTLNNDEMSSTESNIKYNDYTNSEDLQTFTNFDLSLSLLGSSTYSEYTNINLSSLTLNNDEIFTTESAITYDKHTDTDENIQTINNDDLFSVSQGTSTAYSEYINTDRISNTQNNKEISSNKEITNVYNKFSATEANVQTLKNDDTSSSEFSTFGYKNCDHSRTTLSNDEISLENLSTENFVDTINNESSSINSIFDYDNSDHSITLHNAEISLPTIPTINNSTTVENPQTINYEEITVNYNKYTDTEENDQTWNNDDRILSSESSIFYDGKSDNSTNTLNINENFSTNTLIPYSEFINTGQNERTSNNKEISSKRTSMIYDDFVNEDQSTENLNTLKNTKETLPPLDEITYTEKSTDILNYGEIMTEKNKLKSTENDFITKIKLLYSSEDRFDYLIEVDNSTNIENFKQSEYKDSTNVDDDYLIIVRNFQNKQNLKENITDSKLETDPRQPDHNQETVTNGNNFRETSNDLVVTYSDKKQKIKINQDSTPTKVESLHHFNLFNSGDDRTDYLIKVDINTNTESYNQSNYKNITNSDDDYLIIVTDFNNTKYENNIILDNNLNLYSKAQTESELLSDTEIKDFENIQYKNNDILDNNLNLYSKAQTESELLSDTEIKDFENIKYKNNDILDNNLNLYSKAQTEFELLSDTEIKEFENIKYKNNNILDNNLNLYSKAQTESELLSDTEIEDFDVTVKDLDPIVAYIIKTIDNKKFQGLNEDMSTEDESLDIINHLNADEDIFDYLIKP